MFNIFSEDEKISVRLLFFFFFRMDKAAIVRTPKVIPFTGEDKRNWKAIGKQISSELKMHGRWTPACTSVLENNPTCLFLYDRFDYGLKKAFGAHWIQFKINPYLVSKHFIQFFLLHKLFTE